MALLESCRAEIVEFNGLSLIADFLNEKPSNYISYSSSSTSTSSSSSSSSASSYDFNNNTNNTNNTNSGNNANSRTTINKNIYEPELLACERVQQKSAIAISRFCKEKQYSMSLIDLSSKFYLFYLFYFYFPYIVIPYIVNFNCLFPF